MTSRRSRPTAATSPSPSRPTGCSTPSSKERAMSLLPAQLQTLSTHIAASPDLAAQAPGSDGDDAIARLLNLAAVPAWVVWRTSVTWDEIMLNGMDWARVDNLSVGKSRIWDWMFQNSARSFNPSKTNIRAGIDA